jgi:hypothetical protein
MSDPMPAPSAEIASETLWSGMLSIGLMVTSRGFEKSFDDLGD